MADSAPVELRTFRVVLVLVIFVVLGTAAAWGVFTREQRIAAAAAQGSFDDYNHYIDACNGQPAADVEWDLATRARETLRRESARRDAAGERADVALAVGGTLAGVLIAGFYALRWALVGRWRPWWVGAGSSRR